MANINIGVNISGSTPPGGSGPSGGGGGGGKPQGGGGSSPGGDAAKAAAEAAAREAAARRALTQRLGKVLTDAQVSQISRDFAEMSRSSQRLRRFGGDLEKWMDGFRQTFPSQRQANRHYQDVMQQLGLGQSPGPAGVGGLISQALRGIFRATGLGGGVAGSILHQSYTRASEADGGVTSSGGLGMLGKGAGVAALAYAGIKAVQKVAQKVGDAQDEATQYHDLRRSVGSAAVDFDTLRDSVRHFTKNLGVSNAESVKLARSYAASAQVFGSEAQMGLGGAAGHGIRISRGYGLAPEAGVDFLATMRHFKASDGSDKENRKLAYLIGDAVGKTGAFSKADEVMSAIAQFTESTSRQSLQVANVAGYAGMLGALGGMRLPGMDARGAASLMGQVGANWAGGGGEAGLNMRLGWAQRFGARATDMGALGDAGPWASAMSTFGEKSSLYKLADGDPARQAHLLEMAQRGGNRTFFDQEVDAMKAQYGAEFLPMAMMSKYGVSDIGARSLIATHGKAGGMSGLKERVAAALSGSGKDPEKIGMQQMGLLSMIDNADSTELAGMRDKARKLSGKNALSESERAALNGAQSDSELKTVLTQIHAMREVEDEGKTARQAQIDLDRKFQEFATKIIPLTNMIQEGIFKMLDSKTFGGLSPEMQAFQNGKKLDDKLGALPSDDEQGRAAIMNDAVAMAKRGKMSLAEERDRRQAITAKVGSQEEKEAALAALLEEKSFRENVPESVKKLMAEQAAPSSGGQYASGPISGMPAAAPSAAGGGKGPRNLRNNNPGNIKYGDWAKVHGAIGSDGTFAIFPDAATGSAAMDALLNRYSTRDGLNTVSGIVGKWAPPSENDTGAYAKSVAKRLGVSPDQALNMNDPKVSAAIAREMARVEGSADAYIPPAARAANPSQNAKVDVNVTGTMTGPDGRAYPLAANASGQFQQTAAGVRSRG